MRSLVGTLTLLVVSLPAFAQTAPGRQGPRTPEQFLSSNCQFYFRYDGAEAHRKSYEKTAVAKVMKEGLADFFDHLLQQTVFFAMDNLADEQKTKVHFDGFLQAMDRHGFVVGLELAPPTVDFGRPEELVHLTIVFPQGAAKGNRAGLEKFWRSLAAMSIIPLEKGKMGARTVEFISEKKLQMGWWVEDEHLIFTWGAQAIQQSLKVIDGGRPNLTAAAWYAGFATYRYETDMRCHVDLTTMVDWLAVAGMERPQLSNFKDRVARQLLLNQLGLNGLKDLSVHLGFDGKYQRSTVRLGVVEPERRTGLLRLATGPIAFDLDQLPPLPPDADSVAVHHVDWGKVHDFVRTTYRLLTVSQVLDSGKLPSSPASELLGDDFRKEVLDQLDSTVVTYGAHSEGPFILGQGLAVKVKDAARVRKSLTALIGKLAEAGLLTVKNQTFRGHEIHVLGRLFLPITYTVHKDWLVIGLFPQPVQGFLLRSGGKYKTWKLPPEAAEALARERKENKQGKLLAVEVSDPRPAITMALAILPVVVQSLQAGGIDFIDVAKIPNAQSINEWLFPNTMLLYDDGNALRWEHHYSLNEVDDLLLLMASPLALSLVEHLPFYRKPAQPAPAPEKEPVQEFKKMPAGPGGKEKPPVEEPKLPTMSRATAFERDGAVWIRAVFAEHVPVTETRAVKEIVFKDVGENGVTKKIPVEVMKTVEVVVYVKRSSIVEAKVDGKTTRCIRRDGKAVEPRELLKLLAKESSVVLVRTDSVDPASLPKIDGQTLIVIAPQRDFPENSTKTITPALKR